MVFLTREALLRYPDPFSQLAFHLLNLKELYYEKSDDNHEYSADAHPAYRMYE